MTQCTRLGVVLVAALALLGALCSQTPAADNAQQLTVVSQRPVAATFAAAAASFGVTLRNDSTYTGLLTVRLVLDKGGTVGSTARHLDVGGKTRRFKLSAVRANVKVPPRAVRRVALSLAATPAPSKALTGVLVISTRAKSRVSPATVPIRISPAAVAPSRFAKATITPPAITVVVRRGWPSFVHGSAADTRVIGDPRKVAVEDVAVAQVRAPEDERELEIAGDTGGAGKLKVTIAQIEPQVSTASISVEATEISRQGNYEATVPLDASAPDAPELTVKIVAGDHWIWPLVALLFGASIAYWQVKSREMVRPKRVLQLALTRAQARDADNRAVAEAKQQAMPYTLAGVFPTGDWDCKALGGAPCEALQLFCAIENAERHEDLDAVAIRVADIEARVNAWPNVCAKADVLAAARRRLDDHLEAALISAASKALLEPVDLDVSTEVATIAYMLALDDQVAAASEWLIARALLAEAERLFAILGAAAPVAHDPARWLPDLQSATSSADLVRCAVIASLCRDIHVLRARVLGTDIRLLEYRGEKPLDALSEAAAPFVSIQASPPARPGPAVTKHLVTTIGAADVRMFTTSITVVAVAYMALVYSDTFGSVTEYLTALAAGAGATFAANWKMLPWFSSYKPPTLG